MIEKLKQTTRDFIALNGFKELTSVQKECLVQTRSHKDIVCLADTGTGKTHAYLLPIAEMINPQSDKTQVVISLPTRELAYQVYENARVLAKAIPDLRISLVSGGTDKKRSISKMEKAPHIIIGTPGRIKDLFVSNAIRVDFVQMFVIDEADMTLEYGFLEDIDVVFASMVKDPEVLCYSATFPEQLKVFVRRYLSNPKIIEVKDRKRDPKIDHILIPAKHQSYQEALLNIIPGFNPYVCLIFANSKEEADETAGFLNDHGIKCLLIHGGLENRDRQKAIKALASKEYTYVVASDVASRGIDIDGITHVVSLGFPKELSFYTHRAGRTGRNGRDGVCYAIYKEEDLASINSLYKKGFRFKAMEFKKGTWKTVTNPSEPKKRKNDLTEKEIAMTLRRKKEKVKPNYKKKKNMEIEKIKRQKRREFIRSKIREERVERYKQQTREKKNQSE